jgi:hypothetical protein
MRTFEREHGWIFGARPHGVLICTALGIGLWGIWLALEVAASTLGVPVAIVSAATVFPLAYWPIHAAVIGDWLPSLLFYGGWSGAMLLCALYEATYYVGFADRAVVRKPR